MNIGKKYIGISISTYKSRNKKVQKKYFLF